MSLMVWLPLNGDLTNQGLSGVSLNSNSTPVYDNNGKIGKCYSTSTFLYNDNYTELSSGIFSVAYWVKYTSFPQYNEYCVSLNGTSSSDYMFMIGVQTASGLLSVNTSSSGTSLSLNKWYHVAYTYNGTTGTLYLDGTKIKTWTSFTCNKAATHLTINGRYGSRPTHSGSYLNDVRIYNHCLSAKEVKEISKGLVLHYPLDNNGLGNPNLVVNSQKLDNKFSTATSAWSRSYTQEDSREEIWTATCTTAGSGGVHTAVFPKTTDKIGKQYTWSCWIKANRNISLTIGSESGGTKVKAVTTEWQYLTHTWTFTDATYQSFVWYANSTTWAVGDWFKVKDLKIEEGPEATPWCPNFADSLYSSWGMNETIEKDCSGYKNHGTRAGTFLYSSSSPRDNMSTIFSGAQSIAAGRTAMVTDAITVSWWGYMDNWANYTRAISCTESGGWNFEPNNGKMSFPIYRNGGYLIIVDTKAISEYTAGWHHFVATYDGYKSCLYADGVKKGTSVASDVKYPITYNSSNGIFVGAEAGDSTTSPAGSYFNGYISDVRIYSTALSENDIKELYQIPISIDKVGNIFGCDFIEETKPEFNKTGIVEHQKLMESSGANILNTEFIGQTYSYTPGTGFNATMNTVYADVSNLQPGEKVWVKVDVEWSGFDTSNTSGTFALFFQGDHYSIANDKWEWTGSNAICSALNSIASSNRLTGLVLSQSSGKTTLITSFTSTAYPNTYNKVRIGVRSDYSNGVGRFTMSNIEVIPDKYYIDKTFKIGKTYLSTNQIIEV